MTAQIPPGPGIPKIDQLVTALTAAKRAIKNIVKDRKNQRFGYSYTSAEAMLTEVREVLASHGLTVIPTGTCVRVEEGSIRIPINRDVEASAGHAILCRSYLIAHTSGQAFPASQEWPIVPEKGRPLDKATAAADTASLSYFLRDLLQIPRVEEGTELDDDSRDRDTPMASKRQIAKLNAELDRHGIEDAAKRESAIGKAIGERRRVHLDSLTLEEAVKALEFFESLEKQGRDINSKKIGGPADPRMGGANGTPKPESRPAAREPDEVLDDDDGVEARRREAEAAADAAFGDKPPEETPADDEERPTVRGMTEIQRRGIEGCFEALRLLPEDTAGRRKIVEYVVQRKVGRLSELSYSEAQRVVEALNAEVARKEAGAAQ